MKTLNKSKVIIAMSGGVDSSVAAVLLKKSGFNVTGVFMRLTDSSSFKKSEKIAGIIAKILKIPFLSLDLRKEFKKEVIDYFIKELRQGRTPNPCVVCNKKIKFGALLKKTKELNIDFLATGHYAKTGLLNLRADKIKANFPIKLSKAKDKDKDQSYFLWQLKQEQLKHILFPIGNYKKDEIKMLADKFGILKLARSESQEICFIDADMFGFLTKHFKRKPGKIINTDGRVVGQHQGLIFYTIGQRKGIRIGGGFDFDKAMAGKPFYVLKKDLKKNILIVTKNKKDLYEKELTVKNMNWILKNEPKFPLRIKVKIRYGHKASAAVIKKYRTKARNGACKIIFDKGQKAVTPGQSAVFYKGKELLGGGIIS